MASKPFLVISKHDILARCSTFQAGKNTLAQLAKKFPEESLSLIHQDSLEVTGISLLSMEEKKGNFFLCLPSGEILLEASFKECVKHQKEGMRLVPQQGAQIIFAENNLFVKI